MRTGGSRWMGVLSVGALVWIGIGGLACRKENLDPVSPPAERAKPAEKQDLYKGVPEEPFDEQGPGTPRLQLLWKPPDHERQELWSVKLDGGDPRPVVSPELLYSGEVKTITHPPRRSPDGRYVALSGITDDDRIVRFLVDRKTHTLKTIKRSEGGVPSFNWTPDGKHLMFRDGDDLLDYAVDTGELSKLPIVHGGSLQLLEGGKQFLSIRGQTLEWHGRDGKLLRSKPLPFDETVVVASPTGKYMVFAGSDRGFVIDTNEPGKRVYELDHVNFRASFGPDDDTLYGYDERIWKLSLSSGKKSDVVELPAALSDITYVPR